jgi:hypothetical protein
MQASATKKSAVSGETVASYAKRTGMLGVFSTRGAEVRGRAGWKRVGMTYRIQSGEVVRPAEVAGDLSSFDLARFFSALTHKRMK